MIIPQHYSVAGLALGINITVSPQPLVPEISQEKR